MSNSLDPNTDNRAIVTPEHAAQRAAMKRAAPAKLAATIILVRGDKGREEILVGLRSKKHDFMPDVYVFPGGRVDGADSYAKAADHLNSRTRNILETSLTPSRARATVLAAVRETFEETGFVIGEPVDERLPRTKNASWNAFYETGHLADLSEIHVIGRATTPPYRPKRFDTWFFMTRVKDDHAARHFMDSDELLDTQWVSLKGARDLKMHIITEMMLDVLETFLATNNPPPSVPFSRFKHGTFTFDNFP